MKALLILSLLLAAGPAFAKPTKKVSSERKVSSEGPATFSAFAKDNTLYVTMMGDDCNSRGGSLEVDGLCRKDRLTRNLALTCGAKLDVMQTMKACSETKAIPVVIELDLAKTDVAPEATVLKLTHGQETIQVRLK